MKREGISRTPRRSVNLSMDAEIIAEAKALGVNVSRVCEKSLAEEVRQVRGERWAEENREAIEAWNVWIEKSGLPFEEYRKF